MIISLDDNKRFNALLRDIRNQIAPECDAKGFRQEIKNLDPNFPLSESGINKISMRDITQDEFEDHLVFVKTMCIKQGIRLEYFTDIDVITAEETTYKVDVSNKYEEDDSGRIIVGIVCSNCGCETIRGLTDERYDEARAIASGKREERHMPRSASFICINCLKARSKNEQ